MSNTKINNEVQPVPKPRILKKTQLKQQLFAENYVANGMNGKKAAQIVYPNQNPLSVTSTASRLLTIDNVQNAIKSELEQWLEPESKLKTVKEIGKIAYSDDKKIMSSKVKCLELMTKIQALQTEKIEKTTKNLNINIDFKTTSPQELQRMLIDGLREQRESG